jgi:hypothetical protein
VIWATQVLENLTKGDQPSHAEITDLPMGRRAECVMLHEGPHIPEAVEVRDDLRGGCRPPGQEANLAAAVEAR